MKLKVTVTDPVHYGTNMLLHVSTTKGYGAIVQYNNGYTVVWSHYGPDGKDGQLPVHTYAWAKRMLHKNLGASW